MRMGNPARIGALVVGATLIAWTSLHDFRPALAGPALATVAADAPAGVASQKVPGRVYLFRGALGPFFSRGMDKLADRLEGDGITARVYEFTICRLIAESVIRDYREAPAPVVLIGHSMGGLCALTIAGLLEPEHIPVSLVVTIDPAHASPDVPLNVERFINVFLSDSVLGGGDIAAEPGYRGHYASFDLKEHKEVTHINIDKVTFIHEQLAAMIRSIADVPAMAEGERVPLRYVVPPEAAVELWDSGTPLPARSGDTLSVMAAAYHVPLWSLLQANHLAENAPLATGQRVIVPRHLAPVAAPIESSARR
jgi:thioesterase domain-containing protein